MLPIAPITLTKEFLRVKLWGRCEVVVDEMRRHNKDDHAHKDATDRFLYFSEANTNLCYINKDQ
jgi:hypothetical protein